MTFVWFGWGKSFHLRSFAMTGAFLVFPLVWRAYNSNTRYEAENALDARGDNSL